MAHEILLAGAILVLSPMCLVLYGSLLSQTRFSGPAYVPTLFYYFSSTWIPILPPLSTAESFLFGTSAVIESMSMIVFMICGPRKEKVQVLILMALLAVVFYTTTLAAGHLCFVLAMALLCILMGIESLWMYQSVYPIIARLTRPFLIYLL